jgi:hypothetical protein
MLWRVLHCWTLKVLLILISKYYKLYLFLTHVELKHKTANPPKYLKFILLKRNKWYVH